jgi:hypothetical protein
MLLHVTDNTTLTPILLVSRFARVVCCCALNLTNGGRIIESVGIGRERTLQS